MRLGIRMASATADDMRCQPRHNAAANFGLLSGLAYRAGVTRENREPLVAKG
jgi:hypothetical protein